MIEHHGEIMFARLFEWILDSGATSHIVCKNELLSDLVTLNNRTIKVANDMKVKIKGIGNCSVKFKNSEGEVTNVKLTEVLFVPHLSGNFISIKKLIPFSRPTG